MGQSSSRYQENSLPADPSNSTPSAAVAGVSSVSQPESPMDDGGADTSNSSGSRRSSFRKSILKLVKSSNIRNRVNSVASNPRDVRRSWRNSRRWSKAQPDPTPALAESLPSSSSDSSIAGPSTLPHSPLDKGKQREINSTLDEDEEYHDNKAITVAQTPQLMAPLRLPNLDSDNVSSNVESSHTAPEALEIESRQSHPEEANTAPVIHISELGSDAPTRDGSTAIGQHQTDPSSLSRPQIPSQQQQQLTPLPPRQFPPPGTLVVVQGIVHTTDVSRPAADSVSPSPVVPDAIHSNSNSRPASRLDSGVDQGTPRARSRLSALLRPRSISSRPSSTIVSDVASISPLPSAETDSPILSGSESPITPAESFQTQFTTPAINEPLRSSQDQSSGTNHPLPTMDSHPSAISSSSIDVLGTLLSVAAAATAASLLTGSSEPILSSGLAPANANPSSQILNPSPSTASLPNLPSYSGMPPDVALPDISAAGRAERMREAWGTIRQRLGLRPSAIAPGGPSRGGFNQQDGHSHNAASSPQSGDGSGLGSLTDTRELMLAEMARAFNIGLGLNGLGGLAPNSNNEATVPSAESITLAEGASPDLPTTTPGVSMPPEGSFERFLVDLQIDLRIALTQGEEQLENQERSTQQASDDSRTAISPSTVPSFTASTPSAPQIQTRESQISTAVNPELLHVDENDEDMPSLEDVSDSESEFDEDGPQDEGYEDDDFQSAERGSAVDQSYEESPNVHNRSPTSGTGHIDATGRINWWRLYRFPPIVSPRMETPGSRPPFLPGSALPVSASLPSGTPPTIPNPDTTTTRNISGAVPLSESGLSSSQTSPTAPSIPSSIVTPARDTPLFQSVVPVIVVGLQSVNSEWRPDMPIQGENEGIGFFGQPGSENHAGESEISEDDDLDGWGGQHHTGPESVGPGLDGTRGRGRARGWHSRAANAIRNLRPGRRNTEAPLGAQTSIVAPGSRTFLIYVIGGYYPPDHSIVTGGPNILDSFEALLELADLLGQVKPPTVSKDDIEKSGLEIIKASEIAQHEQDGKISSNCTDRCLICLDDYEQEDQVRVMSCRHAFHKGCVDEWLHKGRNNCPACRSTGVNTDGHSTATPVS